MPKRSKYYNKVLLTRSDRTKKPHIYMDSFSWGYLTCADGHLNDLARNFVRDQYAREWGLK